MISFLAQRNKITILNIGTKNAVRLKTRTTRVGVVIFLARTSFHVFKINFCYAAILCGLRTLTEIQTPTGTVNQDFF